MNVCDKLAVFDLDGTLSRTDLFSVPAIQQVQRELGFPVCTPETITSIYGATLPECMSKLFPGSTEQTARDYQRLIPGAERQFLHLAKPYPGIPELLQALKDRGYQTAVCSNASYRYISASLEALGLMSLIDHIQELEEGMTVKSESLAKLLKKTAPKKAVMVGDTLFDYHAAQENHLPFIGCQYGFRPYEMEQVERSVASASDLLSQIVLLTSDELEASNP